MKLSLAIEMNHAMHYFVFHNQGDLKMEINNPEVITTLVMCNEIVSSFIGAVV